MIKISNQPPRRQKAFISTIGTTQLHLINPFIVSLWSALFPGFGHLLLGKYVRGYILFLWEITINLTGHINLAIFYSCTGNFELAKSVVDKRWALLYIPTFVFAVWDSYRTTVDLNHQYILASREDTKIESFKINAFEINYVDKAHPLVSAAWSAVSPGLGQLAIHKLPEAFFILISWIIIAYFSKLLPAIQYTLTGGFVEALSVINKQWFLNVPSIFLFSIYASYADTIEINNLFDWEQSIFLNFNYQNSLFEMPTNRKNSRGKKMYIVSTFEHTVQLEIAITAIQMQGIAKEDILAVPLDARGVERKLFDTIHSSDNLSILDVPMILSAFFGLFGSIYGFVLPWGPIIVGVIGGFIGFSIGLAIKLFTIKKYPNRQKSNKPTEVVVIILCKDTDLDTIKDTLWANNALGVRKLNLGDDGQ